MQEQIQRERKEITRGVVEGHEQGVAERRLLYVPKTKYMMVKYIYDEKKMLLLDDIEERYLCLRTCIFRK